jgi:GntR family transcriptional repressor for pyruvate dehydrogenase complex
MSKTVKKASSADAIYNALLDKIEKHYWDPGDRLPAENDLAEEYGVSRVTIRAVLQKLSALGLVETRSGGGTYVSKFNFFSLIQSVSGVMFSTFLTVTSRYIA